MRRMAVFGGTFDPPHIGHVNLLSTVCVRLALDGALVLPASVPPHKTGRRQTPYEDRFAMTTYAFAAMDTIIVSDLEAKRGGLSYTIDTLKTIRDAHPEWQLYFITGGDAYEKFTTWHKWQEILDLACLVITNRPGYVLCCNAELEKVAANSREGVLVVQVPPVPISSTEIRALIANKNSVEGLVSPAVLDYIKKHRLYEENGNDQ